MLCLSHIVLIHFLQLLSAHLSVLLWLASLILTQVAFFHLFKQFGVLCFSDFLISDTHVGVVGSDTTHCNVGHISEGHF